ncbi:hypothetical protein PTMSG1_00724 [Pyrenophora teres f. maculata]|nr:hypothetical protein PTMSG1_00724 [Pyrenophora teres f. maculata]
MELQNLLASLQRLGLVYVEAVFFYSVDHIIYPASNTRQQQKFHLFFQEEHDVETDQKSGNFGQSNMAVYWWMTPFLAVGGLDRPVTVEHERTKAAGALSG